MKVNSSFLLSHLIKTIKFSVILKESSTVSGYGLEKELYLKPVMKNNNVKMYNNHSNHTHPLLGTDYFSDTAPST